MPLVSALKNLKSAQENAYAIPLFDIFEMGNWFDIISTAAVKKAPVIGAIYSGVLKNPESEATVVMAKYLAEKATVPVSLMLDHGSGFDTCMKALRMGFTDVMFDGSKMPIDENIAITKKVVEAAHLVGAGVEAELGHVGSGNEYDSFGSLGKGFTDPDTVEHFVNETGVDLLAIAIGTAHGEYKGSPKLDYERLDKIRKKIAIPLVLHGGTGLSEEQFTTAIKRGISKINVATDLVLHAKDRMIEASKAPKSPFFAMTGALHKAYQEKCGYYLDLFGASNRA